ncbi:MAG: hypothetical protein WA988_19550 [Candidatus Nanopelagicales bacterium]
MTGAGSEATEFALAGDVMANADEAVNASTVAKTSVRVPSGAVIFVP